MLIKIVLESVRGVWFTLERRFSRMAPAWDAHYSSFFGYIWMECDIVAIISNH